MSNNSTFSTSSYEPSSPTTALVFPWVTEILGVVVFFVLNRWEIPIPYAAIMFLVGAFLGYGTAERIDEYDHQDYSHEESSSSTGASDAYNQFTDSVVQWSTIPSGVLLLVFLPGLIFRDAIEVNLPVFCKALPQILILAFPMVLVGTLATAAAVYYAIPSYAWPLSLAATLGAVLSSTDPVAVSSVLKAAGAPPRLQMHLSGESMLNDGSAVVFFAIFSQQFMSTIVDSIEPVHWGMGFKLFFQMALGGTAVGLAFAAGLLGVLYELDRRLEPQYNVLQVVAALTVAYLSYYVSEQVFTMSGVIACVVTGLVTRAFGRGMIRDNQMMDNYLALMEFLLNTLLFTLGGVVYGKTFSNYSAQLGWDDVGYLLLVYSMVMAIRFGQVTLFAPVFRKVGLGSNIQELAFLAFGGIRGAVGIALALSLTNRVAEQVPGIDDPEAARQAQEHAFQMEFLSGGVTFLTLFVNGTLAPKILRWLGLAKPRVPRKRQLKLFQASVENYVNGEFQKLMYEDRFLRTNVNIVQELVPFLTVIENNTIAEEGEEWNPNQHDGHSSPQHRRLQSFNSFMSSSNLLAMNVIPPITTKTTESSSQEGTSTRSSSQEDESTQPRPINQSRSTSTRPMEPSTPAVQQAISSLRAATSAATSWNFSSDEFLQEVRGLYIDLLKSEYADELLTHDLDMREDNGTNLDLLLASAAFAEADADHKEPLHDWQYAHQDQNGVFIQKVQSFFHGIYQRCRPVVARHHQTLTSPKRRSAMATDSLRDSQRSIVNDAYLMQQFQEDRATVLRAVSFIQAHKAAEVKLVYFVNSLAGSSSIRDEESTRFVMDDALDTVLSESHEQISKARAELALVPAARIDLIISLHVATILLRRAADFTEQRAMDGFLTKKEAQGILDDIDQNIQDAHDNTRHHMDDDASRVTNSLLGESVGELCDHDEFDRVTAAPPPPNEEQLRYRRQRSVSFYEDDADEQMLFRRQCSIGTGEEPV